MKLLFLLCTLILLFPSESEQYVKIQISLSSQKLQQGKQGTISIQFKSLADIHINSEPKPEFIFDSTQGIEFLGITSFPKDTATGFINTAKPIQYSFKINKTIPPGKYHIKGIMRYFYCSESEGWCNRGEKVFTLPLTIVR